MTALFEDRDLAASVSEKLKVYAQPQRLMIMSCLLSGERNVAEIGAATGIGQPALSQQLAELRRANLVSTRRKAKQIWYALANDGVRMCVQSMEAVFGGAGGATPLISHPPRAQARKTAAGVAGFAKVTSG
ncbi:MAG: helix-turn-helix transcriptional regulator [Parvularculaceae bacterium]|nr:helix-turn-helix transcriptional regulator [Parvularculaceae bacterium]